MNLPHTAVERRALTYFITIVLLAGGVFSFFGLGQLEDPEFTVKNAVVVTMYPGATAEEVELEVTDRLEIALQEMPELKRVESFSRSGMSLINVEIRPEYWSDELPQVWDVLRKRIADAKGSLPPGAGEPAISDDFGDVFGFLMAVVADGFEYAELEKYVDHLKKELSLVDGVARVELWGEQQECIYIEVSEALLAALGLTKLEVERSLAEQNIVVDNGSLDVGAQRLRIETTGAFTSPEDIADVVVRGGGADTESRGELIHVRDIGAVRRGYIEPPTWLMRSDGRMAIGLSISNLSGGNIVELGKKIDARLDELAAAFPIGVEVRRISWQSDLVNESIRNFVINLIEAVLIVLVVLWVSMGLRAAMIVGLSGLVFTIIASFLFMKIMGIDLDPYGGRGYQVFRRLIETALKRRWLVLLTLGAVLALALFSFRFVDQLFFPSAARLQFMVDYWAPEGTRIQQVSDDIKVLEDRLRGDARVSGVSTFLGQGPPRFYLPVDPESPYQAYGQLIVNIHDIKDLDGLLAETQTWGSENLAEAEIITRKYGIGPYETWPVEARFSGPVEADPLVLRRLSDEAQAIMSGSPYALMVTSNWRQPVKKVVADFDESNARWTGITRADIASSTQRAFDGTPVGLYREGDKLLPIMVRNREAERERLADEIAQLQVRTPFTRASVPLSQVTRSIDVEWEDPMVWRWDRRRAITVQGVPTTFATALREDVIDDVEAIELPPGYDLEWDGECRSSLDAQTSLLPGLIPAVTVMAIIVVWLFNAFRPPLVIAGLIPFALIGVVLGLLVTGVPFGFVALLGAMSLAGMMTKNAIVLLDQIDIDMAAGKSRYQAVVDAAVSRLRPVMLAAATTVLGVIPLLQDVFWIGMAVVIMFGLALGAVLTVVVVPLLYACLFRLKPETAT